MRHVTVRRRNESLNICEAILEHHTVTSSHILALLTSTCQPHLRTVRRRQYLHVNGVQLPHSYSINALYPSAHVHGLSVRWIRMANVPRMQLRHSLGVCWADCDLVCQYVTDLRISSFATNCFSHSNKAAQSRLDLSNFSPAYIEWR